MTLPDEVNTAPASEEPVVDTGTTAQDIAPEQPRRQVPLEALEAERHKRQDLERRNELLEERMLRYTEQPVVPVVDETDEQLVSKGDLKKFRNQLSNEDFAKLKRDISEDTYKESNPEAIRQINTHLKTILERKPWLTQSIESAVNRYARAYEIVQDYALSKETTAKVMPLPQVSDAKKIVENAKKPGSPAANAKSANLSNVDYLRSIAGTKEFREYRTKMLQGK